MYNYKIDTTMLPNIWVTWASTKGGLFNKRYWLNCKTGKKKEKPEKWMYYPSEEQFERYAYRENGHIGITWQNRNNKNLWVKSGTRVRFAYVKYHKGIDMIEVAAVGIDTTRKAEPHEWHYLGDRFFINRDKIIVNQRGHQSDRYHLFDGHTAWNPNILFSMLSRLNYNEHATNEFKKFLGAEYFSIGNGRCVEVKYLWHMQEWFKTTQKKFSIGPAQEMVDTLTKTPLSDVGDKVNSWFDATYNNSYYRRYYKVAYFERIDDEWSVIRIFTSKDKEIIRY